MSVFCFIFTLRFIQDMCAVRFALRAVFLLCFLVGTGFAGIGAKARQDLKDEADLKIEQVERSVKETREMIQRVMGSVGRLSGDEALQPLNCLF